MAHDKGCLTQAQEVKKRVGPDAQDLVYRPGYAIRRYTIKGVCVCVCVCMFYGKMRTCYILERSGGQGGEKAWEEQKSVGSRILLEGLALLR